MSKIKNYFTGNTVVGFMVLAPIVVFAIIIMYALKLFSPLSDIVVGVLSIDNLFFSYTISISIVLGACFLLGSVVKSKWGIWSHRFFETYFAKYVPFYERVKKTYCTIKSSIMSYFEKNKFETVVAVNIDGIWITCFLVNSTKNGADNDQLAKDDDPNWEEWVDVYNPFAPMPTTGDNYSCRISQVLFLEGITPQDLVQKTLTSGTSPETAKINRAIRRAFYKKFSDGVVETKKN